MTVCFVTDSYPPNIGGAETAIQKIAEGIFDCGDDVLIVTSRAKDRLPFSSKIPESNIIRIFTPVFLQRFWFLLFSVPVLIFKARRADIFHGTSYGGIMPAYIAGRILGKPALLTVHEFMGVNWIKFASNILSGRFYEFAERLFARLPFNKFVAVSNFTAKTIINAGADEKKVVTIYNGESNLNLENIQDKIAVREKLGFKKNDYVIAAYGRTGITKGFEFLAEAIPEIINRAENVKFLLIFTKGSMKIWHDIQNNLQKIDQSKFVSLASLERNQLFENLNAADAVIIPSLSEGFGYTTREAGLLGKNIIASNTGSIPEVIQGNYILFEPGSSDAIVEACMKAVNGNFTHSAKKEFRWEASILQYRKIYDEILAGHED